jgi:hypothetical protein
MSDDLNAGGPAGDLASAAPGVQGSQYGGGPVRYGPPSSTPPGTGGPPGPPPRRSGDRPGAQGWLVALIVVGVVGGILLLGWVAVTFAQRSQRAAETLDPFVAQGYTSTTFVGGLPVGGTPPGDLAPPVVPPPADAATATTEIAELYRRIFTPTESREMWEADFTDATGLRALMDGFGAGSCAAGSIAVVTSVQFTSDDTADVEFRFEGPNVPEVGRAYVFRGGAQREPGGPWRSTPDAVHQVVDVAAGYCG